jgi:hypothetical protein
MIRALRFWRPLFFRLNYRRIQSGPLCCNRNSIFSLSERCPNHWTNSGNGGITQARTGDRLVKSQLLFLLSYNPKMAPKVRLERTTERLTGVSSTIELLGNKLVGVVRFELTRAMPPRPKRGPVPDYGLYPE